MAGRPPVAASGPTDRGRQLMGGRHVVGLFWVKSQCWALTVPSTVMSVFIIISHPHPFFG